MTNGELQIKKSQDVTVFLKGILNIMYSLGLLYVAHVLLCFFFKQGNV